MLFTTCDIPGLIIIEPKILGDSRGYFFEAYNEAIFKKNGITCDFLQDNQSQSSYGVIRGLHYQMDPHAQAKLLRVLAGRILDVAVDIRKGSPTYGKYFSIELSAENKKQLFIPAGFAHGFSVLSETAEVLYKCDNFYNKESESGIRFDDPEIGIDWKVDLSKANVSEKDNILPQLKESVNNFEFHK
jgi:dTDP-4-dehydrorhamnose 3,5-epimerase